MRLAKNGKGKEITVQNLSDIFVKQQEKGAHNINLVTPTMYVYQIIEAIKLARKTGLKIPIIYNSNGYENVETIKMLNGYIDVYLPDLKYYTNELSKKYSNVDNYFEVATNAIKEMYSQVGNAVFDDNGIIQKGVIIRHLVLPNHIQNTKNILKWINENLPKDIYVISGKGFRIFCPYSPIEDEDVTVLELFDVMIHKAMDHFTHLLGCEPDKACTDITRISGLAHDPNAFFRKDAVPFCLGPNDLKVLYTRKANETRYAQMMEKRKAKKMAAELLESLQ